MLTVENNKFLPHVLEMKPNAFRMALGFTSCLSVYYGVLGRTCF